MCATENIYADMKASFIFLDKLTNNNHKKFSTVLKQDRKLILNFLFGNIYNLQQQNFYCRLHVFSH